MKTRRLKCPVCKAVYNVLVSDKFKITKCIVCKRMVPVKEAPPETEILKNVENKEEAAPAPQETSSETRTQDTQLEQKQSPEPEKKKSRRTKRRKKKTEDAPE